MKRLLCVLSAVLLASLLVFAGCGKDKPKFELESYETVTIEYSGYEFSGFGGKLIVDNASAYKLSDLEIVCDDDTVTAFISATYYSDGFRYVVQPRYNGEFSIKIRTKNGSLETGTRTFKAVGGKARDIKAGRI